MGWSSGTDIVCRVAKAINKNVPDEKARLTIYKELVSAAEDLDWDCLYEAEGIDPILDKILKD